VNEILYEYYYVPYLVLLMCKYIDICRMKSLNEILVFWYLYSCDCTHLVLIARVDPRKRQVIGS